MKISCYIKQIRPLHILKNFAIMLPAFYYGYILNKNVLYDLLLVFINFTFAAFIIYTINDIFDIEEDKKHPSKKERPIPKGELNKKEAFSLIGILSIILLSFNFLFFNMTIAKIIFLFIAINLLYSWKIKKIPILDAITVSSGFILRIIAGFESICQKININMLIWIFTIAILIALAKNLKKGVDKKQSRLVLNIYLILSPLSIIFNFLFLDNLPVSKVILLSLLFFIIGILRFYYYLTEINKHLSPFEILLNDRYLFFIVLINIIFCFKVIYL